MVLDTTLVDGDTTTYTYQVVDIMAEASDATTQGTAEEVQVMATIPDAADYKHIHLSPDLGFRTSAGLYTRTYGKSQFNDRTLTLRAGPRFLFEKFDLRPELTAPPVPRR